MEFWIEASALDVHGEPGLGREQYEAEGPQVSEQELIIAGDFGGKGVGEREDCVKPAVDCGGARAVRCGRFNGE
ncbi:hypothetical protein BOTBODRAFT_333007 [Botryobasidium botryosum FD-172 SS1]|uniref:Uncharacterized protein n=1 Tax=Botryobasidium botryosum (strain FD-172 SS1) TaxID=930990 RepID=A0A067MHC8_BOTB1|nr:hypothetical protein BOTBODRAFT_333007 [Botryobasidium botryosum FD-172 SS1]